MSEPIIPQVPTVLESAREKLADVEAKLAQAQLAKALADEAMTAATPDDPDAHVAEMARRREACARGADLVAFWTPRLADAKAALVPLERADLETRVQAARAAVSSCAEAMRLAVGEVVAFVTGLERQPADSGTIEDVYERLKSAHTEAEEAANELRSKHGVAVEPLDVELAALLMLRPKTKTPAGWLRFTADALEFIEGADERARERADAAAEREHDRRRAYEARCLRGDHGPAERERAESARRDSIRQFYGVSR